MEWRKSPNMPGTIIADEPRADDETEQFYGGRVVCEAVANGDDMNKILAVNDLLAACEEDGADRVDDKPNGPALLRMAASILNGVGYPTVAARLIRKARAEEVAILKARGL